MLTMNHTAVAFLKVLRKAKDFGLEGETVAIYAQDYIKNNIACLLLPDAIRMYGPRQQFHFTEHPYTKEISSVKFNTKPNKLKGIKEKFKADLKEDIPKCVIDEMSHPSVFAWVNPSWEETAYNTHLHQDCAWDKWIREMVDISERFNDRFTYYKNGRAVDGTTFRKELGPLDNVFFQEVARKIESEFGIEINDIWFEKFVYLPLLRAYDEELAVNTWKYINLPSMEKNIELPDFVPEGELEKAVERMVEATILF